MSVQTQMFNRARKAFASGRTLNLDFRLGQLKALRQMYDECEDEIVEACKADLRKPRLEGKLLEKELLRADVSNIIRNFNEYTKPVRIPFNWLAVTDKGVIKKDPYGTVLIMGAWNYPFNVTLMPFHGAIAAGNTVIIKPSEVSNHSAETISRLIPKYLDAECYQVFNGGSEDTEEMLKNQFDYVFVTGSNRVGRSVAKIIAERLTPCTLELGGKCPAYIDQNCNYEMVVKRILWGKCINLGQTCIAPDYVLCSKEIEEEFLKIAHKVLLEWFGENPQKSPHLGRIINEKHFSRLMSILDRTKGTITLGGETNQAERWVAPTLVSGVDPETDSTMEEEIFGPILPFITCGSHKEAIKFINERPKPLCLYVFSKDKGIQNDFMEQTSSGDVTLNDLIWHNSWEGLPFGGVGASGMGKYHGRYSVETFTHKKSILKKGFTRYSEFLASARYAPYSEFKIYYLAWFIRSFHKYNFTGRYVTHILASALGAGLTYYYFI